MFVINPLVILFAEKWSLHFQFIREERLKHAKDTDMNVFFGYWACSSCLHIHHVLVFVGTLPSKPTPQVWALLATAAPKCFIPDLQCQVGCVKGN